MRNTTGTAPLHLQHKLSVFMSCCLLGGYIVCSCECGAKAVRTSFVPRKVSSSTSSWRCAAAAARNTLAGAMCGAPAWLTKPFDHTCMQLADVNTHHWVHNDVCNIGTTFYRSVQSY